MKRAILLFACVVSLLIGAAAIVAWVRSYPYPRHSLSYSRIDSQGNGLITDRLGTQFGELKFWHMRRSYMHESARRAVEHTSLEPGWHLVYTDFDFAQASPRPIWEEWGFAFHRQMDDFYSFHQDVWGFLVPIWAVVVLSGIIPLVSLASWARARRRTRRLERGQCPNCGYDMRATPRRCSECGWTAPQLDPSTLESASQAGQDTPSSC